MMKSELDGTIITRNTNFGSVSNYFEVLFCKLMQYFKQDVLI